MADFSLKAVFGLDTTGVKTELKQLRKEVVSFAKDWAKIGFSAATAAFIALSKSAVDLAGKLSDVAANIGINVESFQALSAQHKRNGVSEEQLTKALEKTKSAVIAAADGNKQAAEALAKLGLKASELIRLPLDQQYEAIAKAAAKAKDQNEAYSAVTAILGEKVGPKLMGSLKELAEVGLPGVTKSAKEAGQVMSAETIVALDRAGDAIDDFKKRATIAVGNILVNFRTEEGFALMGMQLTKVVGSFLTKILDVPFYLGQALAATLFGVFEGSISYLRNGAVDALKFVAEAVNKILPAKFEINIGKIEELKGAGISIGDAIAKNIALTKPTALTDAIFSGFDDAIEKQKEVVAAVNAIDLKPEADKLRDAGLSVKTSVTDGAATVKDAGKSAGTNIASGGEVVSESISEAFDDGVRVWKDGVGTIKKEMETGVGHALREFGKQMNMIVTTWENMSKDTRFNPLGARGGSQFNDASDEALAEIARRNRDAAARSRNPALGGGHYFDREEAGRLEYEAGNAERELAIRAQVRRAYNHGGTEGVYNALPDKDPLILDRLIQQFAQQLPQAERTTNAIESIQRGLTRRGLIPSS